MTENTLNELSFDIVVVGGGFAGAYCARNLGYKLGPMGAARVALVAEQNVLAFQPMLAEVVGASVSPLDVVTPLREFCKSVNVFKGTVVGIDLEQKKLSLDAGRYTKNSEIYFKQLVLALGSSVDVSKVPGMSEHGYVLKYAWDAVRLRVGILERLEEANLCADVETQRRLLTFVIVGGGYSGVETAGQILDLTRDIKPLYRELDKVESRVVLVHSRDHLLPEIGPELGDYAEGKLRKRGMEIILNDRVLSVSGSRAYLGSGKIIETNTVLSTVGNTTHVLLADLIKRYKLENLKGRITTDPEMRVKGQKDLWAIGDCAAIPLGQEASCPATAQFALRQGEQVSGNILAAMDSQPLRPFKYASQGELASIGHRTAVAKVAGFKFSGFFAWLMWRGIYVSKLPGLNRKLRVLIDWVLELFFRRDISVIRADMDEIKQIHNMHFEKGDEIFREGDPYGSIYIIKSGTVECFKGENKTPVRTLKEGDAMGGKDFACEEKWRCTAVVTEPTTLIFVSRAVFKVLRQAKFFAERLPESQSSQ